MIGQTVRYIACDWSDGVALLLVGAVVEGEGDSLVPGPFQDNVHQTFPVGSVVPLG